MTHRSKRELKRALDRLEPNDGLGFIDFLKIANGEAAPEDYGHTEADLEREWKDLIGTIRGGAER